MTISSRGFDSPLSYTTKGEITLRTWSTNLYKKLTRLYNPYAQMTMKKCFYIFMVVGLSACNNEDVINGFDIPETERNISFGVNAERMTRAGLIGADAAEKLNNQFYVYGTKHLQAAEDNTSDNDIAIFNNYLVKYVSKSDSSTQTNTSNWEYVGNGYKNLADEEQYIRYWDYSAKNYVFTAISVAPTDIRDGKIIISKTTTGTTIYDKGYTLNLTADADVSKIYVSDRLCVKNKNNNVDNQAENEIGGKVVMQFRNPLAQVRVGMYETIPGYSLTIDAFHVADESVPAFGDMTIARTDKFAANLNNMTGDRAGTMTISYAESGIQENMAKMTFTTETAKDNILLLGTNLKGNTEIGNTSATATYDKADQGYTYVYPMENNVENMKVKMDFTLNATTGESITVTNATTEIPAEYLKWKSGYSYTYLFKISDNTNGTIGSITGLYPITFDAVAIADGDGKSEVISTSDIVNGANIITMGYNTTNNTVTTGKDSYNIGDIIYASIIEDNNIVTVSSSNPKLYYATTNDANNYPVTELTVNNYLASLTEDSPVMAYEIDGTTTNIVTSVPAEDGNSTRSLSALSWTAEEYVYAIVYTKNDNTKICKVIKVDGVTGITTGNLSITYSSTNQYINKTGGSVTVALTVDDTDVTGSATFTLSNEAIAAGITIDENVVTVPASTTVGTYEVTGKYMGRKYNKSIEVKK